MPLLPAAVSVLSALLSGDMNVDEAPLVRVSADAASSAAHRRPLSKPGAHCVSADTARLVFPPPPAALLHLHVTADIMSPQQFADTYSAAHKAAYLVEQPPVLHGAVAPAAPAAPAADGLRSDRGDVLISDLSRTSAAAASRTAAAAFEAASPAGAVKDALACMLADISADPDVAAALGAAVETAMACGRSRLPEAVLANAAIADDILVPSSAGSARSLGDAASAAPPAHCVSSTADALLYDARAVLAGVTFEELAAGGNDGGGGLLPYPQLLALVSSASDAFVDGGAAASNGSAQLVRGNGGLDCSVPPPRAGCAGDLSFGARSMRAAARALRDSAECRAFVTRVVESALLQLARELLIDDRGLDGASVGGVDDIRSAGDGGDEDEEEETLNMLGDDDLEDFADGEMQDAGGDTHVRRQRAPPTYALGGDDE